MQAIFLNRVSQFNCLVFSLVWQFIVSFFSDNSRHLELGCKRPYLEATPVSSEEHYFRPTPSYESSLLSHPYCTEGITSREPCMYSSVDTESGSGTGDTEDLANSPSLNCNMWATMQPYPCYGVEGVSYQPFTAHFTNAGPVTPVVPHPSSSMVPRPQADLSVYNASSVQRGLPIISPSSSSSSCSPVIPGPRERPGHPSLYHKKTGSPLHPHRDFTAYPAQGTLSIRDPAYQYQVGLSSAGTHWTDS